MEFFNEEDIKKTYEFLNHEKETEIRLIDPNGKNTPKSMFVKNLEEFKNICIQYSGDYNVYTGINERKEHGTTKNDVISLQTIIVDVDPKRKTKTSSTKEELKKAEELANKIKNYLSDNKIKSYKAMSGNGFHLWIPTPNFKIDDKCRNETEVIIQNFHRHLQAKFETEDIKIDNIGDLPRIIKIIGTLSIKGENTKERPHRISKWIDNPIRRKNSRIIEFLKKIKIEREAKKEKIENTKVNMKLNLILQFDKKMGELLEGKLKKKYETNSEMEMAIVSKLCIYDFNFDEINEILNKYNLEKWKNAPKQYKELTYTKGREFSEMLPKNALAEHLSLDIQAVLIYPNKDDSLTKIVTNYGAIEMNTTELLNSNKFKTAYYFISSGHMLQPIKSGFWAKLITYWTKENGRIMKVDKSTEDEIIKEKIIDEIEGFMEVDDIKKCTLYGRLFKEGDSYLIPSSSIENILKKNKFNAKMTKVAYWLQDYLSKPSKPRRINKKLVRFWHFKIDKIHLDNEMYLENDDKND